MNKEAYTSVWSVDESKTCFGSANIFASILVLAILAVCIYLLKVHYQFAFYSRARATYSINSYTVYSTIIIIFVLTICKTLSQVEVGLSITGHLWVTGILFGLQIVLQFILQPTFSTTLNAVIMIRSLFVWIIVCLYAVNRRQPVFSLTITKEVVTVALLMPTILLVYLRLNSREDQVEYLLDKAKTGNVIDLFEVEIRIVKHLASCPDFTCPCNSHDHAINKLDPKSRLKLLAKINVYKKIQSLLSIDFKDKLTVARNLSEAQIIVWFNISNEIAVTKSLSLLRQYQTCSGQISKLCTRIIEICLQRQAYFGTNLTDQEVIDASDFMVNRQMQGSYRAMNFVIFESEMVQKIQTAITEKQQFLELLQDSGEGDIMKQSNKYIEAVKMVDGILDDTEINKYEDLYKPVLLNYMYQREIKQDMMKVKYLS